LTPASTALEQRAELLEVAELDLDLSRHGVSEQHALAVFFVPTVLGLHLRARRVDLLRMILRSRHSASTRSTAR
jgi:hypothetical protein